MAFEGGSRWRFIDIFFRGSNAVMIGLVGLLCICAYACESAVLDNLASSSNRCCADFLWYPLDEELFQLSKPYTKGFLI